MSSTNRWRYRVTKAIALTGMAGTLAAGGLLGASSAAPQDSAMPVDDIHAFQRAAAFVGTTYNVNTANDTTDAAPGDGVCADAAGDCSLRAAVQEANAAGAPAKIRLQDDRYALSIAGADEDAAATGDLDVSGTLTIESRGATLDAAGLDRAFDVAPGAMLSVERLTVKNGRVTDASGGAYRNAGSLYVDGGSIGTSAATGAGASGGAIFNDGGRLQVVGVTMFGNEATRAGGAVEANGGRTDIRDSHLLGNQTGPMPGNGGAFHLTGMGRVDIRDSLIQGNTAASEGGGVWNSASGRMTVSKTDIVNNAAMGDQADNGGGGLFNDGGFVQVDDSTISDNRATVGAGSGGGLFNNRGVLRIHKTDVENNAANRAGGGIEAVAGSTDIRSSKLKNNDTGASPGNGGALHLTGAGFVSVDDSRVEDNTASAEGGGLWVSAVGTMLVTHCDVKGNVASGDDADQGGGGLFNDGGFLLVDDSKIEDNVADGASGSGGGLLNNGGELEVYDSRIKKNEAPRAGGGVEARNGLTRLDGVKLEDNSTGPSPGNGGGLHLTGAGEVYITSSKIKKNDAAAEGGGLWNSATGRMFVNRSDIKDNDAPVGVNVFNDGGTFVIDGEAIEGEGYNRAFAGPFVGDD